MESIITSQRKYSFVLSRQHLANINIGFYVLVFLSLCLEGLDYLYMLEVARRLKGTASFQMTRRVNL